MLKASVTHIYKSQYFTDWGQKFWSLSPYSHGKTVKLLMSSKHVIWPGKKTLLLVAAFKMVGSGPVQVVIALKAIRNKILTCTSASFEFYSIFCYMVYSIASSNFWALCSESLVFFYLTSSVTKVKCATRSHKNKISIINFVFKRGFTPST